MNAGTAEAAEISRRDPPRSRDDLDPLPLGVLWCSLTSCCDLSGASPDDGRFPVRPSSLTPSTGRRRPAREAGVTQVLRKPGGAHVTPSGGSQPGGLGKHSGRSVKRTIQRRNAESRQVLLAETVTRGWRLAQRSRKPGIADRNVMGQVARTRRRRVDGTCGQHSSESREGLAGRRGVPAQRRRGV
jgi:hypothetical protein